MNAREIFMANHKPLIDILVQQGYNKDSSLKTFLKRNEDQFRVKLGESYQTPIDHLDFKDVKVIHTPTPQVQEFAKALEVQMELNKQLSDAVKKRDADQASELMKIGADPNAKMKVGLNEFTDEEIDLHNLHDVINVRGLLHFAVIKRDIKMAIVLLFHEVDVNAVMCRLEGNRTALYCAVEAENLEMVKLLLTNGADVNSEVVKNDLLEEYSKYTSLYIAIQKNKIEIVELIVDQIAKLQAAGKYVSPGDLQRKVKVMPCIEKSIFIHNHKPLIDILLQLGYDGNNMRDSVKTFLEENKDRFAVKLVGWHEIFLGCLDFKDVKERHVPKQKLQEFAELLGKQIELNKQLSDAVKERDSNRAIKLIQDGADINAPDEDRNTPIHLAANEGHSDLAELLFNHGAEIDLINQSHKTPVLMAAEKGFADVVEFCVENGASVNTRASIDDHEKTLLHFAAKQGHCHLMAVLIKHGADINAPDEDRNTPIHLAAKEGYLDLVTLLFNHGAKIELKNKSRETPALTAAKKGFSDVVKFFIENGASVNTRASIDDHEKTLLHFAAEQGNCHLMAVLIKHGADINAKDFFGNTPLNAATKVKRLESVKFLLGCGADPNLEDIHGKTSLWHAVRMGLTGIIEATVNCITKLQAAGEHVSPENLQLKAKVMPKIETVCTSLDNLTAEQHKVDGIALD